jgi:PAS domain S-box-containing protein
MKTDCTERRAVLVVDDDEKMLDLLVEMLRQEGYEVAAARDGGRALKLMSSFEPDVVISDVVMPIIDGIALCRRLKDDPRTANIPILLISGNRTSDIDTLEGLTAGADDYLDIPFRHEELLVKVARLAERHRVEKHYREIVEQAVDIIYSRDMDGYLTSINNAGARFFGRSVAELVGTHLSELIGAEAATKDIAETRDWKSDLPLRSVHCLKDVQGTPRYLEGVISVEQNGTGEPARVRGVVRDVTEQKQIEEALRESEARYRIVAETASDAIITVDESSTIMFVNSAAVKIFGYSVPKMIGASLTMLMPECLRHVHWAGMKRYCETGRKHIAWEAVEVPGLHESGQEIPLEISFGEFHANGKRVFTGIIRDITERKRMEAEREVIYQIIQGVNITPDLDELLKLIHHSISKLLYAENCFVALHDPQTDFISFEFWADKFDPVPPPRPVGNKGFSSYVLRTGKPLLLTEELTTQMYERGEVEKSGTDSPSWLGVPLRTPSRTIGVLAVQHYEMEHAYSERDLEFLTSVGSQIALAIERKRAEEALRQREGQYRRLVDQIPDAVWTADEHGHAVFLSERITTLFGYAPAECYRDNGRLWFESMHPTDRERVQEVYARLFAENQPYNVEYRMRHRDGQWVWWHDRAVAIYEKDGVRYADGLVSDITERKRAEEALRESEDGYRELFENANDIIYAHDLKGNFTSLNTAGERITGYSREEARRMNIADVVAPEYLDYARQMISQKSRGRVASVYELEIITKDNRRVRLEVSTKLIYKDRVPVAIQGFGRDLTDRKRSEEALRESQTFFHSFMNNSPAIAFMKDEEGRYVYVNEPFERFFGQNLTFLRGKKSFDWLPEKTAKETHQHDLEILSTGKPQEIVETVPLPDGSLHHWLVFKFPMNDASGRRFVAGVGVDITERRSAQEALAQQADREALTHRISQAVRRSLDSSEIFQTAVRELGSHLSVDRCSLFIKDERAKRAVNVAEYHTPGVEPAGRDFDLASLQRLMQELDHNGVLAFSDPAHDERISDFYDRVLSKAHVRSIMYVAIRVGDDVPAAFVLTTTRVARDWNDSDVALAKAVADQTGIAIRQAQLFQKAEATSTREALANRLSLAIRASLSLSEVLNTATHELGRALAASRVHLHLYNPENHVSTAEHEYVAPGCLGSEQVELRYDDPIGQHLRNNPKSIVIADALNNYDGPPAFSALIRSQAEKLQLRSQIYYPLLVNGVFRGALCINQTDRIRYWTDDELALVESVAAQLATGIAQAELFEMVARGKQEWETTFDAMSDGIFIFDRAGWLKRVNTTGAGMESTSPRELLGRKCCDILRTSAEDEACIVEQALSEARSVTVEITPERLNRPLLVTTEPVRDSSGKLMALVCTARDLSELRKVEAVAREHQSLLTNILESARESIYAVDTAGRFQWCNSATLRGLGYKREEFIGRHLLDMVYEGDRELVGRKLEDALKGESQTYEMRYFARDGKLRYARVDKSPLVVEGRTTGVLGIARDITGQKEERERAARADKLRALGQLASGVAHDFNNSLAAILGRTQLLRRQTRDDALLRNLGIIQTAAEDAAATVRRIQTFARKSPAREFELLEVRGLLHDAVEITRTRWQNEARLRGLDYDVTLDAEAGLHTYGSASELREVFVNLIVNAVDAMPRGGRLAIGCAREGDRLNLSFADNGTGMPEDVREKIFEPFFSTKGAQGTGLGLSVSYSIIERHEGVIKVESEVDRGTTFTIDIPAAELGVSAVDAQIDLLETPPLSILVIDDEPAVRETLADMLVALKHNVATADGGRQAIRKLAGSEFDLVFTDLAMPEMDGWETAREIRLQAPETKIVLVTGYGTNTAPPQGEDLLVDGIIGKPFDFDQVGQVITQVFKGRKTPEAEALPVSV